MYFQIFSVHGLIRYNNMELGRDADTGGQVKYVVELGEALSRHPSVRKVDLFTRLISDKHISEDYSQDVEKISDKFRIIRIQCGGKKYIRKEFLWQHLDEFIDKTINFIRKERDWPDIIHGHYADAGYVAIQLSEYFGVPFVFTGHSLGRPKKSKLLKDGYTSEEINKKYRIEHRIETEEEIIKNADLIITSTYQEIDEQYGMYGNKKLAECRVIPPGLNLSKLYPYYHDLMKHSQTPETSLQAQAFINEELNRFFMQPDKPLILALCRADKRKNIAGLVDAFGKDLELQAMANLAIFAGIRKNIVQMEDNEKDVLTQMLLLMDKYDLYGKMAIPKKHDATYEVPELYRIAAAKRGVFVNIALTEPFGLTLIEASACGLPIVATNDGGPKDIVNNCQNGILVDPSDTVAISSAIKSIIVDHDKWRTFSKNGVEGVRTHYNWQTHVNNYIKEFKKQEHASNDEMGFKRAKNNPIGDRLTRLNYFLITDIDSTLLGDDSALETLIQFLKEHRDHIGFGVASGRTVESIEKVLAEYNIHKPDIIIASVGSEIYYRDSSFIDRGWFTHISKRWNREKIKKSLDSFKWLTYQPEESQRPFKISYNMENKKDRLAKINQLLIDTQSNCSVIYSHEKFLDILPHRASKGKAIKYLRYKWGLPLENIIVCGDSGNDEEMLRLSAAPVVVSNYSKELERLKDNKKIYFSTKAYAAGILDGIEHYQLFSKI